MMYEIEMLGLAAIILARSTSSVDEWENPRSSFELSTVNNALLESFTVHARALVGVFYPADDPINDDVLAADFLDDPTAWATGRPGLTPVLTEVRRRVGKEIAHLTYTRLEVTAETKQWRFLEIAFDLLKVVNVFVDLVPESRLVSSFRERLEGLVSRY